MSGGHFNYQQYMIEEIADSINDLILKNDSTDLDNFGYKIGRHYSSNVISKFKEAEKTLRIAAKMVHRIDWLVSGDDGEDTFLTRWKKEIYQNNKPLLNNKQLLIIAGSLEQAKNYAKEKNLNANEWHYIMDIGYIRGFHNCLLVKIGNWYDKKYDLFLIEDYCKNNNIKIIDNY